VSNMQLLQIHSSGQGTQRRSGKCNRSGTRRAGQDRAAPKGSLDAPKRSRIIEARSDA